MPIYEYRCEACGHQDEHLQKVSEAALTECPACHKPAYKKQLSAAGFQLKGSGWYATDFKGSGKKKEASKPGAESKSETASDAKTEANTETKTDSKPAAKPKSEASTTN